MTEISLQTPISSLITNKRRVNALKSLGVENVADALTYYPFRVTDPVSVKTLNEAVVGSKMATVVRVRGIRATPMSARGGYRLEVNVDDDEFARQREERGAVASLVYFSRRKSYIDWMSSRLRAQSLIVISGEPSEYNDRLQFTHPEVLTVAQEGDDPAHFDAPTAMAALERVCRPRPVYHANSRISSEHIHDTIMALLMLLAGKSAADATADARGNETQTAPSMTTLYESSKEVAQRLVMAIPNILPASVQQEGHYMGRAEAFSQIHDPDSVASFQRALATMRCEEAIVCQTALLMARAKAGDSPAIACADTALRDKFIDALPFTLTDGQRDVIREIGNDMEQDHPMQRLLEGEVGSGKTVVAIAAMLQAVGSGQQAVMVAPTLVLAQQHYASISKQIAQVAPDVPVVLLTGGMKLAARRRALATAASGQPCIVIATHAAFSATFQMPNMALAVIDEQHRFGVDQRETLRNKGEHDPHLLVMTATPIPRTAAMTWFGDLDISWLTELPGGRKPIRTFIIDEYDGRLMGSMFAHVRSRIDAGERAYIICSRIDEDEEDAEGSGAKRKVSHEVVSDEPMLLTDDDLGEQAVREPLHSVDEIYDRLQALPQFADVAFCRLTGRDDDATKAAVMEGFASGKTPVMVATTVIEVGVDVPQASCIIIFDADRYGLSQLHQLRGRVGRGGTNSWAFLVSRAEPDSIGQQRLDVIAHSLDGAEIAREDVALRGAGDVLGDAQSGGKTSLKLLRVVKDAALIEQARAQAQALLDKDPALSREVQLAGAVLDFTRGNEGFLTSN